MKGWRLTKHILEGIGYIYLKVLEGIGYIYLKVLEGIGYIYLWGRILIQIGRLTTSIHISRYISIYPFLFLSIREWWIVKEVISPGKREGIEGRVGKSRKE